MWDRVKLSVSDHNQVGLGVALIAGVQSESGACISTALHSTNILEGALHFT